MRTKKESFLVEAALITAYFTKLKNICYTAYSVLHFLIKGFRIAGNFLGVLNFVIFGVQSQARNLKPKKMSTCVLCLSARYSNHEIKNHEN